MKTLESAPSDIDQRIQKILDAQPSSDYNFRQIQLMVEKFFRLNPTAEYNHASMKLAEQAWTESGDSEKFGTLSKDPRFEGDVANITVEDMEG